jgi:hypothetical protein
MNTAIHKRRFGEINFDQTIGTACHRLRFRTQLSSFPFVVALLIFVACASTGSICAQSCQPAVVSYIIRDESGRVLGKSELNVVYERISKLPTEVGAVYIGTAFMAKDRKTFYSPYSEERARGEEVPLIAFGHDGPCRLKFSDATLEYHGKKMRLIFDVDIPSEKQPVHDLVIDSLPFQEGTFKLDLSGLAQQDHRVMAATRWKKVSSKSE